MTDSVREALAAAMAEHTDEDTDQGVSAPAAGAAGPEGGAPAGGVDSNDPTSDSEQDKAKPEGGAQQRDATGKFAKAPEGAAQTTNTEAAPASGQEPPTSETIRVPASLPAALKAKFSTLAPEWQDAFRKRDEDVNAAKAQWDTKAQRLNRFDEIFAPRREKMQLSGLDEFTAVQTLFAAQDLLERNPVEGLSYLARSYGVDLRSLAQQATGQGQGQQQSALIDPALQPVFQRVQTLEQQLAQQQQATDAQVMATVNTQIEEFRNDPKHLYFDNVRDQMIALFKAGAAKTLAEAYETAIWASPEIRPLLLQEQQAAAARTAAEAAERDRAARAARASGSVTGGPGAAAQPQAGASKGSVRDDLRDAWDSHAA